MILMSCCLCSFVIIHGETGIDSSSICASLVCILRAFIFGKTGVDDLISFGDKRFDDALCSRIKYAGSR